MFTHLRKRTVTRRRWIVNGVLGIALVVAISFAVFSIGDPATATSSTARTATATIGDVTATVSASGNVTASDSVGVNFEGSGGTVTAIYVRVGDEVHKGQALAKVDDASARQTLETAEASLASAQAQYETATQGQTAAEQSSDQASIGSAQVGLQNAQTGLAQAQQTYATRRTAAGRARCGGYEGLSRGDRCGGEGRGPDGTQPSEADAPVEATG